MISSETHALLPNGYDSSAEINSSGINYINHFFKRAPGVFDIVCYTGTGTPTNVVHNLGVAPEMMIVKRRSGSEAGGIAGWWMVYHSGLATPQSGSVFLNTTDARNGGSLWNSTNPTSTVFTVNFNYVNYTADTYVAYLFATKAGISKVGTYLGTNASQNIDCGFTAGPRFLMIKRTDAVGDWYIWDSIRGITTFAGGNDPHLSLNSTAAEVTTDDSVDTYINGSNSGFTVKQNATTNLNLYLTVSTASYIYLAIA